MYTFKTSKYRTKTDLIGGGRKGKGKADSSTQEASESVSSLSTPALSDFENTASDASDIIPAKMVKTGAIIATEATVAENIKEQNKGNPVKKYAGVNREDMDNHREWEKNKVAREKELTRRQIINEKLAGIVYLKLEDGETMDEENERRLRRKKKREDDAKEKKKADDAKQRKNKQLREQHKRKQKNDAKTLDAINKKVLLMQVDKDIKLTKDEEEIFNAHMSEVVQLEEEKEAMVRLYAAELQNGDLEILNRRYRRKIKERGEEYEVAGERPHHKKTSKKPNRGNHSKKPNRGNNRKKTSKKPSKKSGKKNSSKKPSKKETGIERRVKKKSKKEKSKKANSKEASQKKRKKKIIQLPGLDNSE
jgi:hypothetical protein